MSFPGSGNSTCKGKKARGWDGAVSLIQVHITRSPINDLWLKALETSQQGLTHLGCLHLHHPPAAADARLGPERAVPWNLAP